MRNLHINHAEISVVLSVRDGETEREREKTGKTFQNMVTNS